MWVYLGLGGTVLDHFPAKCRGWNPEIKALCSLPTVWHCSDLK